MTAKTLNILIVEDDQDLNKAYQMIIASAGHQVSSAYDGKEALSQEHLWSWNMVGTEKSPLQLIIPNNSFVICQ
jgi:DNA-binding NtrC family response regulator